MRKETNTLSFRLPYCRDSEIASFSGDYASLLCDRSNGLVPHHGKEKN